MITRVLAGVIAVLIVQLPVIVSAQSQDETTAWLEELTREVESLKKQVGESRPGTTKMLLAGYASVGFVDRQGEDASFGADFNPILLWQLGDRILFEGELAIELEDGETVTELEYSQITYLLNDHLTLGAGKFLAPFNIFSERLHPSWINKLPDAPLAFSHGTGIVPPALLGAQARGGQALGASKLNYAVYIANGPTLAGEDGHGEEDEDEDGHGSAEAGALEFDNYDNLGGNFAYGGRVGFLPFPELELGYSLYASDVATGVGQESDVLLQGVDLSYIRDSDLLRGRIDVRTEWAWSDAGSISFETEADEEEVDEHGEEAEGGDDHGVAVFDNKRSGGYVQLAYQPTKVATPFVKNLECVGRYDMIDFPDGSPIDNDEQRLTVGLNYWCGPSAVLKVAYQFDNKDGEGAIDQDAILIQAALGF